MCHPTRGSLPLAFLFVLGVEVAHAQPPAQPSQPAADLAATDPAELARAIEQAVRAGQVPAVARRIREGLPPELLHGAIDALAASRRPDAARVLIELARHRRPSVRVRVARGLVAMQAGSARRVLIGFLDDPSAEVRGAAATGLGSVGGAAPMAELLAAARRGVPEAAGVVGARAEPRHVQQILASVDATTLESYAPLLAQLARRADLAARARLAVVQKLDSLETPAAARLLQGLIAALPDGDPIREAAERATAEEEQPPAATPTTTPPAGGA